MGVEIVEMGEILLFDCDQLSWRKNGTGNSSKKGKKNEGGLFFVFQNF